MDLSTRDAANPSPASVPIPGEGGGWSDERTPNLFLVGAPRAGTSGLHDRLALHPDVHMSGLKEPHFFSTDLARRLATWRGADEAELARPREDYLALFAGGEACRYRGESSVYYLYSEDAPPGVERAALDPRILVLVREPVALLRSLHGKLLAVGDEDERSFATALALEPERREHRRLPKAVRFPEMLFYGDYVRYAHHIARWQARFGSEHLRVIVLEEWNHDPAEAWAGLLAWLGLEDVPLPPAVDENAAVEPRSRLATRILSGRLMGVNRRLALGQAGPLFGLHDRAYRMLDRWNRKPLERTPLGADEHARLRQRFAGEVHALEDLLGRELGALWGYPAR